MAVSEGQERPLVQQTTWPEMLYRFIEHYKWEPQHLCRGQPISVFREKIRRQEPPLNCVLNLLLAWSSTETIRKVVGIFGENCELMGQTLKLLFPPERNYTQADACIESAESRIFIEAKIDASTSRDQVQKYILLHAEMNREGWKRPYLFFLTAGEFLASWPGERSKQNIGALLTMETAYEVLPGKMRRLITPEEYTKTLTEMTFGHATWNDLGNRFSEISREAQEPPGHSNEIRVISDFLQELIARDLWKPSSPQFGDT